MNLYTFWMNCTKSTSCFSDLLQAMAQLHPFVTIYSLIVIVSMAFNNSQSRIPLDIWQQIISNWTELESFSNTTKVDVKQRKYMMGRCMAKTSLHEHIISVIMDMKMQNYSIFNHQLTQKSNSDKLFDEYVLGFAKDFGRSLALLVPDYYLLLDSNQTELSWTRTTMIEMQIKSKHMFGVLASVRQLISNQCMDLVFREFISEETNSHRYIFLIELLRKDCFQIR